MGAIADDFRSGRYEAVLRATVDRSNGPLLESDVAYAISALAFSGRLDEAEAMLRVRLASASLSERALARFSVIVALARAGRHADAIAMFATAVRDRGAPRDFEVRFYLHQSLACIRYFRGLMARAAISARRALDAAISTGMPWARLLASDLRGHALVQSGQVRAGLSHLTHAETLARHLEYDANTRVINAAILIYRARHGLDPESAGLERLRERLPESDAYTPRIVLIELAWQRALRGRRAGAMELLREIAESKLQPSDLRARVSLLLAQAVVARLSEGVGAGVAQLEKAERMLEQASDAMLEVDVAVTKLLLTSDDRSERTQNFARLTLLAQRSRGGRALLFARGATGDATVSSADDVLADDPLGELLVRVASRGTAAAHDALRKGFFALIGVALDLAPASRFHLLPRGGLLVENHGEWGFVDRAPGQAIQLLRLLATRPQSKEELLLALWGIKAYRPDKHDSVVYTAISRLRALCGVHGDLIEASADGGYAIAAEAEIFEWTTTAISKVVGSEGSPAVAGPTELSASDRRLSQLVAYLDKESQLTTTEAARIAGVSEMTALRDLALLVERGTLIRTGRGRATRYTRAQQVAATGERGLS